MRSFVLASLVTMATASFPPNTKLLFDKFMRTYDRHYGTELEKAKRFKIFSDNIEIIYASNAQNKTYTLGITAHADRTFEEWRAEHLSGVQPRLTATKDRAVFTAPEGFVAPESVDWTAEGAVTSVKNQGTCGSCWTFSTVGALEGAMAVSGRQMVDLSMQHILACDKSGAGCKGGEMDQAFSWVAENGVPSLEDEPYLCQDGSSPECENMACPAEAASLVLAVGDVASHTDVHQTEDALEAAVAQQPVSVAIEADKPVFQHYTGGVVTGDACGSNLDHGVLAVGYGVDEGQAYWKVKNSWGTSFGEQGYIRIAKGLDASGGECGIRKMASFPTLTTLKKASDNEVVI